LQTLAITFTGAPIPFGKIGGFPPKAIQDLVNSIKKGIQDGKDALHGLKADFENRVRTEIEAAQGNLESFTANNFATLKTSLPGIFSNTQPSIVTAREKLLERIGTVQNYAANTKLLGLSYRDWSNLGYDDNLSGAVGAFKGHTQEISGVLSDSKVLTLQFIPGYPTIGYANTTINSNLVSVNLSSGLYPVCNIGSTVIVANTEYIVTNKDYSITTGNVSVNTTANAYIVNSLNYFTLNLANVVIQTGSNLKLKTGMYISVNSEIKRVEEINALGDFLTVASPFRNSVSNTAFYKERAFYVNTAIVQNTTGTIIKVQSYQHANSLCLDDVVTGNGTSFLTYLSPGDKIYYDEQEYYVESLTQEKIVVDEKLRLLNNQAIYKIVDETPVSREQEQNSPDEILAAFAAAEDVTTSLGGAAYINGLTTRFKKSDGTYATIDAYQPVHVSKSIQNEGKQAINAVTRVVQQMIDDLQDDAIRFLTESELEDYIESKIDEIEAAKNRLKDLVNQDKAAINALKGLLNGLLKLFKASCSKKKKGDDPEAEPTDSDEFLSFVLKPNPLRQGCEATESDLIDILDQADEEYNSIEFVTPNVAGPIISGTDDGLFTDAVDSIYGLDRERNAGGAGDIGIDNTPDDLLPSGKDPCSEPC